MRWIGNMLHEALLVYLHFRIIFLPVHLQGKIFHSPNTHLSVVCYIICRSRPMCSHNRWWLTVSTTFDWANQFTSNIKLTIFFVGVLYVRNSLVWIELLINCSKIIDQARVTKFLLMRTQCFYDLLVKMNEYLVEEQMQFSEKDNNCSSVTHRVVTLEVWRRNFQMSDTNGLSILSTSCSWKIYASTVIQ